MFLAMQYPVEVPGVSVTNFLRTAMNAVRGEDVPVREFAKDLREQMRLLDMDPRFAERSLNEGFLGRREEAPRDPPDGPAPPRAGHPRQDTDSGLDVDALQVVAEGVNRLRGPHLGVLLITHYTPHPQLHLPRRGPRDGRRAGRRDRRPRSRRPAGGRGYERWRGDPAT